DSQTLQEILDQNGVRTFNQLPRDLLEMQVGFHVVDDRFGSFFIAFFEDGPPHPRGLHAAILDRAHSKWKHALLPTELGGNTFELWERTPQYICLYSHINPSQGNFYVLSTDLKLRGDLFAESISLLPDGSIVVTSTGPHFADTHPLTMSVFSAKT